MPIPDVVDPNPTTLDLTLIGLFSLLVISNDSTPPESDDPNDPIKFELCPPWLESKNNCDMKVSLPSWVSKVST